MQIETTQKPLVRMAKVIGTLGNPQEVWEKFMAIAQPSGILGQPGVSTAGLFPSSVFDSDEATRNQAPYAAAAVIPDDVTLPDGMTEERIPPGRFVRGVYIGPYDGMGGAWMEVERWISERGHQVREGTCYELYRNSPGQVPDSELRTDLYVPIVTNLG